MHTLGLDRIVLKQRILLLSLFLGGEVLVLHGTELRRDIGEDKEIRVGSSAREHLDTLVGKLDGMVFLVDHEEQRLHRLGHLAVVVGHIFGFHLEHQLFDTILAEIADKGSVLGERLVGAEQRQAAILCISGGDFLLGFEQKLLGEFALGVDHLLHIGLELVEHLIIPFRNRTGDDERRTCVVDKHGVDLIDNGIIVLLALYEILRLCGHVVTQVVETELIVGSEGDVAAVGGTAFLGIGISLVNAVYGKAMELIEGTHPFGVTFGEVIVDGHHMHALASECIEEYGKRGHESLTLTGGHLGDGVCYLASVHHAVEHHTSDELHVVMHHVPFHEIAACHPFVLIDSLVTLDAEEILAGTGKTAVGVAGCDLNGVVLLETARCLLHHGEHFGEHTVKITGIIFEHLLLEFVDTLPERLTFLIVECLDLFADFAYLIFKFGGVAAYFPADGIDASTEFVVGDIPDFFRDRIDFFGKAIPERTYRTLRLVAEYFLKKVIEHLYCRFLD